MNIIKNNTITLLGYIKNISKKLCYTSHHISTYGGNVAFWDFLHLIDQI